VAIIDETMARRLSPAGDPLGTVFSVGSGGGRRLEVIGVAGNTRHRSLSEAPLPVFYEPFAQAWSPQATLVARSNMDPRSLLESIRRELETQNPDLAAVTMRTLEDQFEESTAPSRQRAVILAATCGIGLLLSASGLFGVMSYGVRQRVRELGIRMAVGACPSDIGLMVLRRALRLVGTGVAIGLVLAWGAARIVASALFGVTAHDPLTLCVVFLLFAGVAAGAAYLPARWAMRVDPVLSIRAE
jgi:ABC-type antimicrobial peptide transport system permease subunit